MTDFRICNKWYIHVAFLLWNKCCAFSPQNSYVEAQYPIRWKLWEVLNIKMRYEVGLWWDPTLVRRKTEGPLSRTGGREDGHLQARMRPFTRNRLCRPLNPANPRARGGSPSPKELCDISPSWLQPSSKPRFLNTRDTGSHTVYLNSLLELTHNVLLLTRYPGDKSICLAFPYYRLSTSI